MADDNDMYAASALWIFHSEMSDSEIVKIYYL